MLNVSLVAIRMIIAIWNEFSWLSLDDGIDDESYHSLFKPIIGKLHQVPSSKSAHLIHSFSRFVLASLIIIIFPWFMLSSFFSA